MGEHEQAAVERKVAAALTRVRAILDQTRHPRWAADVPHRYEDKYLLAELLTRSAGAALLQGLESLGLGAPGLARLRDWAKTRSVTLRLVAHEDCTFVREETRRVEAANQFVTEVKTSGGEKVTRTDKMVTTVTEHVWTFEFRYALVAFQGTDGADCVLLQERGGQVELRTTTQKPPRRRSVVRPSVDVSLDWLLRSLDAEGRVAFSIQRDAESCHTPRRNEPIEAALRAMQALDAWCFQVMSYWRTEVVSAQPEHGLDLAALQASEIFVPVLPLLDDSLADGVVPFEHAHAFLEEQRRSLAEKCSKLDFAFPAKGVLTSKEARLLVTVEHLRDVCRHHAEGVDSIEWMLRQQLVAAIGKEVTPTEFDHLVTFHTRKLFQPAFRPVPFSYAIRRPDHDPEGSLALQATHGGAMPEAVSTLVRASEATRPMYVPLGASVRVGVLGERLLHAWVAHQFTGASELLPSLLARARQFSSFILLVGRIVSADVFEPRYGVVLQNKDVLRIPLLLQAIPTPKEFRDAIESLSPEQQRFARAFRSMQLESTLFGVCVLQIKPQLERLLHLPDDSLTKEIQLTQDLLGLFVEHQIPSDLLSYDGPSEAAPEAKLARVREYVGRMQQMIDTTRQKELDEAREREAFRLAEANRTAVPARPPGGGPMGSPPQAPPGFSPLPMMPMAMMPMPMSPGFGPPPPAPARAAPAPAAPQGRPPSSPAAAATLSPEVEQAAASAPAQPRSGDAAQGRAESAPVGEGAGTDYTRLPVELDRRFEELDDDDAIRPTILEVGDTWTLTAQKSLLASPAIRRLGVAEQKDELSKTLELIDALSKSGALPFEAATLHVVLAATHCFDATLVDTVIQGNVNPLEKVERSAVIVATTIHGRPAAELLADDQRERFFRGSPRLGPGGPSD